MVDGLIKLMNSPDDFTGPLNLARKTSPEEGLIKTGLRVLVWVISYLFEHTGKDFQSQVLLVA